MSVHTTWVEIMDLGKGSFLWKLPSLSVKLVEKGFGTHYFTNRDRYTQTLTNRYTLHAHTLNHGYIKQNP